MGQTRGLSLLLAVVAAAGCPSPTTGPSPTNEPAREPCIAIGHADAPPANFLDDGTVPPLRFGTVEAPGGEATQSVIVTNLCAGDLELVSVSLDSGPGAGFELDSIGGTLAQGEERSVSVRFQPTMDKTYSTRMVVLSNDPEHPRAELVLEGEGRGPMLQVTPLTWDYGTPYIGCETAQPFTLRNIGLGQVVVSDIQVFTASTSEYALDLDPATQGPLPLTLDPYDASQGGPEAQIFLDYLPLDTFRDEAFLTVYSNDPSSPEIFVSATGGGVRFGDRVDVFEVPARHKADFLFVLNRADAMADANEALIGELEGFASLLSDLDYDHHTAVVVGNGGCVIGPEPYIDDRISPSDAARSFRTMADLDESLVAASSGEPRGYALAELALSETATGSGGCNATFYREDAVLSQIYLSNEAEPSPSSWSHYVGLFQDLKTQPEDVIIHGIAGDYPRGCPGAAPGTGFYEGTVATGGTFASVCETDWETTLKRVATAAGGGVGRFELTQRAVPATVEVKVDGVRVKTGWSYDLSSNSVVFMHGYVPPGGAVIEAFYDRLPDCER